MQRRKQPLSPLRSLRRSLGRSLGRAIPPLALASAAFAQSPAVVLNGTDPEDALGSALTSVGDLNGDGAPELAVGVPGEDSASSQTTGSVHLFSGADGTLLGVASGQLAGTRFGATVTPTRDLSGDGTTDLLVGAPDALGRVVALDGNALAQGVALELWSVDGSQQGSLGRSILPVGDRSGDGVPDVAVGEPFAGGVVPGVGPGRVRLLSGATGALLTSVDGPSGELSAFGWSLATTADVDGDGLRDLAVGAPTTDGAAALSGAVHLVGSRTSSIVATVEGEREDGQLGFALARRVRADGSEVLLAGEPADTASPAVRGRVVRIDPLAAAALGHVSGATPGGGFGRALAIRGEALAVGEPFASSAGAVRVFTLDAPDRPFALSGPALDASFGTAVAWLGNSLAVGAPSYDTTPDGNEGRVEVYRVAGGGERR